MKKILIFLFVISLLLLTACSGGSETGGENDGGGENDPGNSDTSGNDAVWEPYADVYLVAADAGSWRVDFSDEFSLGTGGVVLIPHSDKKPKMEHEIVVGQVDREVSRLAYEALHAGMTDDDDATGYLVYVHDGSLAIAYSGEAAMKPSLTAFLEKCLGEKLDEPNGVLLSDFYSLRERAEENRAKMYEENLAKIKKTLLERGVTNSDAIIEGIEKLFSLYKTEQLIWLANLYDVEGGGFYYSNSGRDNLGYFPDLESTGQAFAMLDRSGLYRDFGGLHAHGIPDFMHESLLGFVRGLQSSEDGFFYHPQWGKSIASSRRSRDLDNAVSLLGYLREQPYYDEPSGRRDGIYGAPGTDAVKPTAHLTSPLGARADFSAVIPASTNLPYYLQSLDAWEHYLRVERPITRDSYSIGNSLASDWALIKAAGPEYVETVINYLNETQIPETGLWEYNVNDNDYDPTDGIGYNGTNGLMKICVLYGSLGYAVPNAYNALRSAIKVGVYRNTDPKDETVCYVLNIWTCLNSMINNVKQNDPENYESARALLMENVPDLLYSSYDLLKTHLMPDGGFSYFERQPMNISQGALVGCTDGLESDINATMVATSSTVGAMLGALELSGMPIWCSDDYYIFMDEFESLEPIVKKPRDAVETFDGGYEQGYISLDLAGYSATVADGALKIASGADADGGSVNVKMRKASIVGDTHFLETDFRIDSAELGEVLRFSFRNASGDTVLSSLTLECYLDGNDKKLRLCDTYAGADGEAETIIDGLSLGEWHRLRMITYKLYSGTYRVWSKVSVDDRYITTSDSSVMAGDAPLDITLGSCKIEIVGDSVELALDNILSEKSYLPYS